MSRSIIALVLMLVAASAFVLAGDAHVARAQDVTLTLSEAIEQGLVQAEFLGTGNASGAAVVLRMRRTVADPLMITVPAGTRLANAAPREQDMVVRRLLGESTGRRLFPPLTQIELRDDETYAFLLEAYCLEAHRDNPSDDAIFNYDGTADATVVAVLNAVDEVPAAPDQILAIQAAVWVITDDITTDELDDIGYGLSAREMRITADLLRAAGVDPTAYRLFQ